MQKPQTSRRAAGLTYVNPSAGLSSPGPLPRSRSGVAAKRQKALWQCQTIHSRKRRVNHDLLEVAHTATPVGV
jgi:hypothetical protein